MTALNSAITPPTSFAVAVVMLVTSFATVLIASAALIGVTATVVAAVIEQLGAVMLLTVRWRYVMRYCCQVFLVLTQFTATHARIVWWRSS